MNLRMWVRIHVSQPSSPVSRGIRCKVRRKARNPRAFRIHSEPETGAIFAFLPRGFRILSHGHVRCSEWRSRHIPVRRPRALYSKILCQKSGLMSGIKLRTEDMRLAARSNSYF